MKHEEAVRIVKLARKNVGFDNPRPITIGFTTSEGVDVDFFVEYRYLSDQWCFETLYLYSDNEQGLLDLFRKYDAQVTVQFIDLNFEVSYEFHRRREDTPAKYRIYFPYYKAVDFITNEMTYEKRYGRKC